MNTGKNKKVGIVTLYHEIQNFGGLLQAYALPVALEKYLGISAEQIDYVFKGQEQPKTENKISLIYIIIGFITNLIINKKITDNIDLETIFTSTFLENTSSLDTIKNLAITAQTNNQIINNYCHFLNDTLTFQNFTNKI